MKNIFELFRKEGREEGTDYGSLQGLKPNEGERLRVLPDKNEVLLTRRGMGQVKISRLGNIVGGKDNG